MRHQVTGAAGRPRPRSPRRRRATWPISINAVFVVVGVLIVVFLGAPPVLRWLSRPESTASAATRAGVGCSSMEEVAYHVHAHLALFIEGQPRPVPANLGISRSCIAWLHTHDTSGILHIEAPGPHTYPLGAFFELWGQPLSPTQLLDRSTDADHRVVAYVNGEQFQGDPRQVPLDPHTVIVLEYGPPFVPPESFTFPSGL